LLLAGSAAASSDKILHVFNWAKAPKGNLVRDAAGNLYGTTSEGGGHNCGIVYKLAPSPNGTWKYSILYGFKGGTADGCSPQAGLTLDTAGNLYGTTVGGRTNDEGTVFKLRSNPDGTWTESVLYSFCSESNCADGQNPAAGLIFDAAGNLYGTTQWGGTGDAGTVFKLAPNPDGNWTESVLYSFPRDCDGDDPVGGLIFDAAGNLYGTTAEACTTGNVFKLASNPDGTWTESVLYIFRGIFGGATDGSYPVAGLVLDAAGNLYGTTLFGGTHNAGIVFKLAPNLDGTWTESVLHSFSWGADGANPVAGLVLDAAGNLYGTTYWGGYYNSTTCYNGCGVVFKLTPGASGWSETVLHWFWGYGRYPQAPVLLDPAGNLYGTTSGGSNAYGLGGSINDGLVFEITP
jgi:uncharacterized repeat protein (TIGR03803 family)